MTCGTSFLKLLTIPTVFKRFASDLNSFSEASAGISLFLVIPIAPLCATLVTLVGRFGDSAAI